MLKDWQPRLSTFVKQYWSLLAIIAFYLLLAVLYSSSIPPFEGPDESEHFAYISWLAEGKGFPPQGDAAWDTPIRQEAGQSPLYYLLASVPALIVDINEPPAEYRPNPHFVGVFPRIQPDNDNRAIHYPTDARPLRGGWLVLSIARALTIAFGVLLLVSVYGIARQVHPENRQIALAATLLVAVTPQVIFISSVASNDIPAAAFSALSLWTLALLVRKGPTRKRALIVGVAYGLAILTKASAIALALPIAIALLWLWLSGRQSFGQVLKTGLWLSLGALVVAGWWLIRTWVLYGSPLGLETHDRTPWAVTNPEELAKPYRRWLEVFRSYWLALGWGTIRPEEWLYRIFMAATALSIAGQAFSVWLWWRRPRPRPDVKPILILILATAVVAVGLSLELWMRRVVAPYGRLLFPAVAAVAILLVTGWQAISSKLPFIIAGIMAVLAIAAPFWLIRPAYQLPEPLTSEDIAELPPSRGIYFGSSPDEPLAELIKFEVLERTVIADSPLPVEICWRIFDQSEQPYAVLVHIIGPDNALISHRRTYPGLGHQPTTLWTPGDVLCDLVRVKVWDDLQETLVYQVEIAMLNQESGQRLPAYDAAGNPVGTLFLGRIRLVTLHDHELIVSTAIGKHDPPVQLVNYELPPAWQAGQVSDFTLEWSVSQSLDKDYQVFVHLRQPDSSENVAQADGPPLDGWYPTSYWEPGEIIEDIRSFSLPADIQPGIYQLFVGLYNLPTGERLGDEHFLGSLEVQ